MDKLLKTLHSATCITLIVALAGCGTLMYPERKGQTSGKIDPNVAILDGIGLLCFLIPGIIAFAVDFSNGTIYLPNSASLDIDSDEFRTVKFDTEHATYSTIENIIESETNIQFDFSNDALEVSQPTSIETMPEHLSKMIKSASQNLVSAN